MKLLSFAVPCYNSADYMEHCVETLLHGGEDVEIIIVDDGSQKDNTAEIADRLAAEHPTIIKAVHQENGGHGQGECGECHGEGPGETSQTGGQDRRCSAGAGTAPGDFRTEPHGSF